MVGEIDESRCHYEAVDSGFKIHPYSSRQCRRRKGFGPGGRYCRQHAPKMESWLSAAPTMPRMAKKRGYSGEFPTTREKRVYFMLDKIPPALWIRVKAKAKREGVSLRALILGWCKEWVDR